MAFSGNAYHSKVIAVTVAIIVVFCGTHNLGASALKCHQCGWDSCGTNEELVECTLERVNQVHGHLQRLANLSQYQEMPSLAEFVCFELRLTNSYGNRSGTVKSCTLQSAKMCGIDEWKTVKVIGCKTCNDRDYCNGFDRSTDRENAGMGFSFSAQARSNASSSPTISFGSAAVTSLCTAILALMHLTVTMHL